MDSCVVIRRSSRFRGIRVSVLASGTIRVSAHPRVSTKDIHAFLASHQSWIDRARTRTREHVPLKGSSQEYARVKARALHLLRQRVQALSVLTGLVPKTVDVRNASSRWGSCSRRGRIMLHYRLMFLPQELIDYVILHELCHLRHFNHSRAFWDLLAVHSPSCQQWRRVLQEEGSRLALEASPYPVCM